MNNSALFQSFDDEPQVPPERVVNLREMESRLIRIIEALDKVMGSDGWSSLRKEIFDQLPGELEKELLGEARKEAPDTLRMARLSGELRWAERYTDLSKLKAGYLLELQRIRKLLYGTKPEIRDAT